MILKDKILSVLGRVVETLEQNNLTGFSFVLTDLNEVIKLINNEPLKHYKTDSSKDFKPLAIAQNKVIKVAMFSIYVYMYKFDEQIKKPDYKASNFIRSLHIYLCNNVKNFPDYGMMINNVGLRGTHRGKINNVDDVLKYGEELKKDPKND